MQVCIKNAIVQNVIRLSSCYALIPENSWKSLGKFDVITSDCKSLTVLIHSGDINSITQKIILILNFSN